MILELVVVIGMNLVVGVLVGICGIAGFMLPIVYTAFLGFLSADALALSFVSFLTSGVIGFLFHTVKKTMLYSGAIPTAVSCLMGAILGVFLNGTLSSTVFKVLLYTTVLLSGCSLLRKSSIKSEFIEIENLLHKKLVIFACFPIGMICALTGSAGPILLVPFMVSIGASMTQAVAFGLFLSIFIALPAIGGYLQRCTLPNIFVFITASIIAQGSAVLIGSYISKRINQDRLKHIVGVLTIVTSLLLLWRLFLS